MAAEWEVIAADPTTGILLFDVRLPADNSQQAIAQSGVTQFLQQNAAQIRARGIDPGNVQILARYAPSGLASEVVPSLFGRPFQPGMQLGSQQQATLAQNAQVTNPLFPPVAQPTQPLAGQAAVAQAAPQQPNYLIWAAAAAAAVFLLSGGRGG
jgi:hypothetical protein